MKIKLLTSLIIGLTAMVFFAVSSKAQTSKPQFLITWKADSYAPADFQGKILPTAGSLITTSFELIDQGKPADLSQEMVYWYVNNDFLRGGNGLQSIRFQAPQAAGGAIDLRVEIPNYKPGAQLKTIEIPVASPKAVIEVPFPNGEFSASQLELTGQAYFFNVRSLSRLNFSWNINGQTPTGAENPATLKVNIGQDVPVGYPVNIVFTAQNPDSVLEKASKNISLVYKP